MEKGWQEFLHPRNSQFVYNSFQPWAVETKVLPGIYTERKMKRLLVVSAVAGLIATAALLATVQAQKSKKVVYASSAQATYKASQMKGVSMEAVWGDADKGAHGTFTKFDPGYDAGMHTHTNDVSIVVIKGAYLYKDEAGEKRVGPGDYLFVPGGHKHWSGGDKTEGAVFYEEGSGKFDLVPAK
jgi:quercetin dioxygenase-like cupin family protein